MHFEADASSSGHDILPQQSYMEKEQRKEYDGLKNPSIREIIQRNDSYNSI